MEDPHWIFSPDGRERTAVATHAENKQLPDGSRPNLPCLDKLEPVQAPHTASGVPVLIVRCGCVDQEPPSRCSAMPRPIGYRTFLFREHRQVPARSSGHVLAFQVLASTGDPRQLQNSMSEYPGSSHLDLPLPFWFLNSIISIKRAPSLRKDPSPLNCQIP